MNFTSIGEDTELLNERSHPPTDAKEWDKRILKLSALLTLIAYVVAGLDSGRYQWSPHLQWGICLLGIVFMFIGQLLFLIAKKTNRFFSSVVRIQNDKGHAVCETGLYRFVRHRPHLRRYCCIRLFTKPAFGRAIRSRQNIQQRLQSIVKQTTSRFTPAMSLTVSSTFIAIRAKISRI